MGQFTINYQYGDLKNSGRILHTLFLKLYNTVYKNNQSSINEIERNYDLCDSLYFNYAYISIASFNIALIFVNDINIDNPYFIVFLGASVEYRRWSVNNYVELSLYINRKPA